MATSRIGNGSSQYDRALVLGNAMSRAPIMIGTRKLPSPPMIDIRATVIIIAPCVLMIVL